MTEHAKIENGAIVEQLPTLPERKTLSTGQTVVGFNTLPPQVLKAMGYLPVVREQHDPQTHYLSQAPEITADAVVYHAIPIDLAILKNQAKTDIDRAAGAARERAIPAGQLIDQEYLLAKNDAAAFKVAGYPANAIPASIQASMTARGTTAQQEADDILLKAAQLEGYLVAVRGARLSGKAAVDAAADHAAVITERDTATAAINAL